MAESESERERLKKNLHNPPPGYPKDGDVSYVDFGDKGRAKVTVRFAPATEEEVIKNRKNLEQTLSSILSRQCKMPMDVKVKW